MKTSPILAGAFLACLCTVVNLQAEPPVVSIQATTPLATATNRPGVFTVFRTGHTNAPLDVRYQVAMNWVYDGYPQATNGVDFAAVSGSVIIPAGAVSNSILITPLANPLTNSVRTVTLELSEPTGATGYSIGSPEHAVVFLAGRTNFPPTVSISSPFENQAYTAPATIPIFASAYDWYDWNGYSSVRSIEFFAGTNSLGVSTNDAVVWTNASAGQYALTAVATGDDGITAMSAPVNIIVRATPPATNRPPTANVAFPFNGETFWTKMDICIEAPVFDLDGSVASVEIFAGTNTLGFAEPFTGPVPATSTILPEYPGFYSLTWSQPPPGDYALTAVATDDGGLTTTSAPVNITVLPGPPPTNLPPVVEMTSPMSGQTFATPTNVLLSAFAGDFDGQVTNVEFFAGNNELGKAFIPGLLPGEPIPWTLIWTNPPPGDYALTVVATDNGGASATSAPVNISVEAGPPVPVVTVQATQPFATLNHPGVFTVFRHGDTNATLNVWYDLGGTASNGMDYAVIPPHLVTIDAGATSNTIVVAPLTNPSVPIFPKTVVLTLTNSPLMTPVNYEIGWPSSATVYIESPAASNRPPSVKISSPTNGATFFGRIVCPPCATHYPPCEAPCYFAGPDIPIYATASASSGTALVEFLADGQDLGPGTLEGCVTPAGNCVGCPPPVLTCTYSLVWSNVPAGIHVLTVVATDNNGLSSSSAPVTVSVVVPPPPTHPPPAIRIISPANGAGFRAPVNLPLFAYASAPGFQETSVAFYDGTNFLGAGTPVPSQPTPVASAADIDLASGVNGTFIAGQSYNETRAVDVTVLSPVNLEVSSMTLSGIGGGGLAKAVIYDSGTQLPIASAQGGLTGGTITLPISATLLSGGEYRVGFYGQLGNGTFFQPANLPYTESSGLLRINGAWDVATDEFPAIPNLFVPQIDMEVTPVSLNLYSLVWTNAPVGEHVLTAQALFSNSNNFVLSRAVSAPVNVTILPPAPPPTNRTPIVNIVATDPVAIEGTNAWVWPGETNWPPTWAAWPPTPRLWFTNCGPKSAIFTVRRFGATNDGLTVTYAIGGSASNGVDYLTLPGVVTIPAGQRAALITLVPIEDGPPDVNKTVILTLRPDMEMNPLPGYVLGFPRRAAAIIIDRPKPWPVSGMLPGPAFHFHANGPDGAWFAVEESTNLQTWTPVCTNQVIAGSIDYADPDAASSQTRFYRIAPLANPPND